MIRQYNILKSALLLGALFLVKSVVFSQDDVLELLPGSEVLEYNERSGIYTLIGNVNFKYQGNIMFCDSALYYDRREIVKAYGHVHINKQDTINLFCDSLLYNGISKKAKLWGNVRVRDNEFKLTTDTLEYDANTGQAFYHHGGRVESTVSREVLTSKVGYFHPDTKNFYFSNDVVYEGKELDMTTDTLRYVYSQKKAYFFGPTDILLDSTSMYCEDGWYNTETQEGTLRKNAHISSTDAYISGDTLLYQPDFGTYIGRGNVYYMDSVQQMSFTGNYAFSSDSLHYALLTGDAIAMKTMKEDTMYIHADTLYSYQLDSVQLLRAYYGAKIFSNDFQGMADSITYSKLNEKIELFNTPIVWSNGTELKGDFIDVDINDTLVKRVNIYSNSTILMEVELKLYYNQIGGTDIRADFKNNDLYRATVFGNAMTIFYPEEEKTTDSTYSKERMRMNRLYASDIRVDIDSNEIVGITYLTQPDGVLYPMDQIKKDEQFVPGFQWKGALRPESWEDLLIDKVIEPEEEIKEELEEAEDQLESLMNDE